MGQDLTSRYDDVQLDQSVWSRSGRPFRGRVFRWTLASTFLLLAIGAPGVIMMAVFAATGVAAFFAVPAFVNLRLQKLSDEIGAASHNKANKILNGFDKRRLVAIFAPHAWVAWQRGRLHLRLGDGRAAAHAFSEVARLIRDAEEPAVIGAEAHALISASDRKSALEKLQALDKRDAMKPRDRMNYGIALLEEPNRSAAAAEHLQDAADALEDASRPLAGLALALAREGEADKAQETLEKAEGLEDFDDDEQAQDLLKRARKLLKKATPKQQLKAKPKKGDAAPPPRKKKDRRRDRREKRRAAKQAREAKRPAKPPEPEIEPEPEPEPVAAPEPAPTPQTAKPEPAPEFKPPSVPPPPAVSKPKPPSIGGSDVDAGWDDLFGDD